ncbi:MAG TPA: MFS transporter [Jatrophihabitans sp.]
MSESSAAPAQDLRGAKRHAHPGLILLIIAGAQLMVVLDATIVNIALPKMGQYFDRNQTDMTWALNAYTLAFGGLLLLGGRAGDILGRRRMFIFGLGLFSLGSLLGGLANSFAFLLVGRVVQGLGGAVSSPTALSLITNEFEEGPRRNRAIAVYAAVSGAGAALGLILGGVLTEYLGWRWVLFVNVPIGIVLIIGAFFYLHQTERLQGRFDFFGALLSVAGMVALVYGFIHAASHGWGNTQSYVIFPAAAVLLTGFVLFEAFVVSDPMMPMRIFENRTRAGSYLVMLIVGAGMFGLFYYTTFFVQGVLDYSPLKTGFAFLPVALVIGVSSQVVSKLLPAFGPKVPIVSGTIILFFAMFWLSRVSVKSGYADTLLPGIIVLAISMGALFVPLTLTAVTKVADTDAGLASALLNVGQQVGGAIGLSVLATVFQHSANSWVGGNQSQLNTQLAKLDPSLGAAIGQRLQSSGSSGLQPDDITRFVQALPPGERVPATQFFAGPYRDFSHHLLAHASGTTFLGAAIFAVVALLAALFLINAKKADLPTETAPAAMH